MKKEGARKSTLHENIVCIGYFI